MHACRRLLNDNINSLMPSCIRPFQTSGEVRLNEAKFFPRYFHLQVFISKGKVAPANKSLMRTMKQTASFEWDEEEGLERLFPASIGHPRSTTSSVNCPTVLC